MTAPSVETTVYAADATAWRDWLERHAGSATEVWLVIPLKSSELAGVGYAEAVEQALCFGWVDSMTVKGDADTRLQRFSPRNPASSWAASNRARAERLIAAGLMRPAGQALIDLAKRAGRWDVTGSLGEGGVPDDLKAALDAYPPAAKHFEGFPPSGRRLIVEWIVAAKKPETRARRVAKTVEQARDGIRTFRP